MYEGLMRGLCACNALTDRQEDSKAGKERVNLPAGLKQQRQVTVAEVAEAAAQFRKEFSAKSVRIGLIIRNAEVEAVSTMRTEQGVFGKAQFNSQILKS